MFRTRRVIAAALAAAAAAGGAATAAVAQASTQQPKQLTFTTQPVALRFFTNSGPITGWPTKPLAPGDRIIGQDRLLQAGRPAGRDNEICTVSFARDVLCQDIVILTGQGNVQASWTIRWPASGNTGPASFNGIIDGGTGTFRAAHGWFHARALPHGGLQVTANLNQ